MITLKPTTQRAQQWMRDYITAQKHHKTELYCYTKTYSDTKQNILNDLRLEWTKLWDRNKALTIKTDWRPIVIGACCHHFTVGAIIPHDNTYGLLIVTKSNRYFIPLEHIDIGIYTTYTDKIVAITLHNFIFHYADFKANNGFNTNFRYPEQGNTLRSKDEEPIK